MKHYRIILALLGSINMASAADSVKTIDNLASWQHPTKAVLAQYQLNLTKVNLYHETYPVFFVNDTNDLSFQQDSERLQHFAEALIQANSKWSLELVNLHQNSVLRLSWDKQRQRVNIVLSYLADQNFPHPEAVSTTDFTASPETHLSLQHLNTTEGSLNQCFMRLQLDAGYVELNNLHLTLNALNAEGKTELSQHLIIGQLGGAAERRWTEREINTDTATCLAIHHLELSEASAEVNGHRLDLLKNRLVSLKKFEPLDIRFNTP